MSTLIIFLFFQNPTDARVSFCAVGDVLLDRGIRSIIKKNSVDYPFKNVQEFINGFDLAFCNLECAVSTRGASTGKIFSFRADTSYFAGAKNAGFDIFSLANNHVIDWGSKACMDTKELIEKNNLYAVGVGKDQKEARSPVIISMNGLTFAFFAYVGIPLKGVIWPAEKPGPAQASIEEIVTEIDYVREEVDFIVVSLHWGTEYEHRPKTSQVEWAHKIIDAGADLILGHHPHVLQSIEVYKNRFILYSLGNFVFDQHKQYQRQTGIFSCVFKNGRIDSVSFSPILLKDFRPDFAIDTAFTLIKKKIKTISEGYNTKFTSLAESIYLTDSTWLLSFRTPLSYVDLNNNKIAVYRNAIEIVDTCDMIVDTLTFNKGKEIKDCCWIKDTASLYLFAIIGEVGEKQGAYLAQYCITNNKIGEAWVEKEQGYNPWKIVTADINGDSVCEICVGIFQKTKFDPEYTNRLIIYNWDGHNIRPEWFGSRRSNPFLDFMFHDIDKDGLDDLITLELEDSGTKRIMTYQWLGRGFWGYRELAQKLDEDWLSNVVIESFRSENNF